MSGLTAAISKACDCGIQRTRIALDIGIGFGKTVEHNCALLAHLERFTESPYEVLVGTSRKRFIGELLGGASPDDRVDGTAATVALAIARGADIVRVHDVAVMARTRRVADAIVRR